VFLVLCKIWGRSKMMSYNNLYFLEQFLSVLEIFQGHAQLKTEIRQKLKDAVKCPFHKGKLHIILKYIFVSCTRFLVENNAKEQIKKFSFKNDFFFAIFGQIRIILA
jgi:hypothetical protein